MEINCLNLFERLASIRMRRDGELNTLHGAFLLYSKMHLNHLGLHVCVGKMFNSALLILSAYSYRPKDELPC